MAAAILQVGQVIFPDPSDLSIGIQDISKAGRNTNGTMIIERIATKRKIEVSYKYLSASELSTVLSAIAGTFFTVTYTDPVINALRTGTFYSGDRTAPAMDFFKGTPRYKDVKFNFVER